MCDSKLDELELIGTELELEDSELDEIWLEDPELDELRLEDSELELENSELDELGVEDSVVCELKLDNSELEKLELEDSELGDSLVYELELNELYEEESTELELPTDAIKVPESLDEDITDV